MKKNYLFLQHKPACHKQGGYVALVTILVISSVMTLVGISVALLSINEVQTAFSGRKSHLAINIVESCVEDSLLRLNNNGTLPSSLTIEGNTCTVTQNSQTGTQWTFTVSADVDDYTQTIQVTATRTNLVSVSSWLELD